MTSYSKVFEIIEIAGKKLKKHHGRTSILKHKNEINDATALTQLDLDTETYLTNNLLKNFPRIGVYGEEFGQQGKKSKYWLIDPIDGTAHFVRGLPFSTTMIALVSENQVIFGLIYDFLNNDFYWAEKGKGSKRNNTSIQVSTRPINRSYLSIETDLADKNCLNLYQKVSSKTVCFHTISSGWEFAMVASGKLDGRLHYKPWGKIWDYAPGTLLVSEAGGIVTNIGKLTYDLQNKNFIATNKKVYHSLTQGTAAIFPVN